MKTPQVIHQKNVQVCSMNKPICKQCSTFRLEHQMMYILCNYEHKKGKQSIFIRGEIINLGDMAHWIRILTRQT